MAKPNPFRVQLPDGSYSAVMARPLELLLRSTGSPVERDEWSVAHDAKWAAHAVPLHTSALSVGGEPVPVQLDWNRFSESLVFTLGQAGDQVRYLLGRHSLLEAVEREQRLTQERRAALQVRVTVIAAQVAEFREFMASLHDEEDDEPLTRSQAAFYDEHPDLAPDPGPQCGIAEETAYETFTVFRLWVSDAQLAYSLGRLWLPREQGPPAGSPEALRRELDGVLADLQGYGWSLARLTQLGENWLGQPVEADEAQESLAYLHLQGQALEARRALVVKLLAQQEGGPSNG